MSDAAPRPVFHLPARDIPVPTSISPQAQAVLVMGPVGPPQDWPAPDDLDAWRKRVADEAGQWEEFTKAAGDAPATLTGELDLGGPRVYVILPDGVSSDDRRVYLDIHGGAWAFGGGEICKTLALMTAPATGDRRPGLGGGLPDATRSPLPRPAG